MSRVQFIVKNYDGSVLRAEIEGSQPVTLLPNYPSPTFTAPVTYRIRPLADHVQFNIVNGPRGRPLHLSTSDATKPPIMIPTNTKTVFFTSYTVTPA